MATPPGQASVDPHTPSHACSKHNCTPAGTHSQDTWLVPAPALSPGLGQAVKQPASEGDRLPLMLLVQLPQVSLLPAPELPQSLVASELIQRGWGHLCEQKMQAGLG